MENPEVDFLNIKQIRYFVAVFRDGSLSAAAKENRGQVILRFKVYDPAAEVAVNLYSKSVKVALTGDLIRTFDDYSLRYTLM